MGPNPLTHVFMRYPEERHTDRREGDVKTEPELGVMQPRGMPVAFRSWKKQGKNFS